MKNKFIVFGKPIIEQPEIDEVVDSMRSGWLGTGPKVKMFESQFCEYQSTEYSIALNSCTAALHLSLLALGIGGSDEVLVPTMTFAATVNVIVHCGATPVFVDCERISMNIDVTQIEDKITPRTKAIIPVHFAGRPCEMDEIMIIANKHNLKVIEDCAHAIETEYKGKKVGTIGDVGCFSFYATKNIVTGEGGMLITNSEQIAKKVKVFALHGMSQDAWGRFSDSGYRHYEVIEAGYKYNMMDIQAAIGLHQLSRVGEYWRKRESIWARYNEAFDNLPVVLPASLATSCTHAYHLYTLLLNIENHNMSRDQFLERMQKQGIGMGVHYIAVHLHPYYKNKYACKRGDYPNAEWISDRTVSLPLSARLDDVDIDRIINTVISVLS